MNIKQLDNEGFEWDKYNIEKNLHKHNVTNNECEEAFFNETLISIDLKHYHNETRYYILGITNSSRLLFVAYTVRKRKIRIISARDANKRERKLYYEKTKKNT